MALFLSALFLYIDYQSQFFCSWLPDRKKWSVIATKGTRPGARDGHSACVIDKKMYIYGGYEEEQDRFSDDVHTYSFETNMWEFVHTKVKLWRMDTLGSFSSICGWGGGETTKGSLNFLARRSALKGKNLLHMEQMHSF